VLKAGYRPQTFAHQLGCVYPIIAYNRSLQTAESPYASTRQFAYSGFCQHVDERCQYKTSYPPTGYEGFIVILTLITLAEDLLELDDPSNAKWPRFGLERKDARLAMSIWDRWQLKEAETGC